MLFRWSNVAIAGGLYGFVDTYAGNVREKDDAWNKFAGGCAAGFFFGMRGMSSLLLNMVLLWVAYQLTRNVKDDQFH